MIPFNADGTHGDYTEFRNAWGLHARIWSSTQHWLGWKEADWLLNLSKPERASEFWALHKNAALPAEDRIVQAATYDRIWIPADLIPRVAAAFRTFALRYPVPGCVDHLNAAADAMEQAAANGARGVGFWGTSVADNPWIVYTPPFDEESDEDGTYTPLGPDDGDSIAEVVPDLFELQST
jgi:hypothetical protein